MLQNLIRPHFVGIFRVVNTFNMPQIGTSKAFKIVSSNYFCHSQPLNDIEIFTQKKTEVEHEINFIMSIMRPTFSYGSVQDFMGSICIFS